ncbi:hypothetical protein [Escherichia coli]
MLSIYIIYKLIVSNNA